MTLMTSATFDLDRYYTPEDVARNALARIELASAPRSCADSSCGMGNLLDAAAHVFGDVTCVGVDRDKSAIRALRKRRPSWALATGDLLSRRSYLNGFGKIIPREVDLLVLNPPFSQNDQKHLQISYEGITFHGSVAMACLTKSLELFRPIHGAILIAPESMLYSETDAVGRQALSLTYGFRKIVDLKCNTFKGARANACVVELIRGRQISLDVALDSGSRTLVAEILRGSLPVHAMASSNSGIRFLHSTSIRHVVSSGDISTLGRTSYTVKGVVRGWAILIPRVGVPDARSIKAIHLPEEVQLSDCVIALCSSSGTSSLHLAKRILEYWQEFRELYKGTGARYITIAHLVEWLSKVNVAVKVR